VVFLLVDKATVVRLQLLKKIVLGKKLESSGKTEYTPDQRETIKVKARNASTED